MYARVCVASLSLSVCVSGCLSVWLWLCLYLRLCLCQCPVCVCISLSLSLFLSESGVMWSCERDSKRKGNREILAKKGDAGIEEYRNRNNSDHTEWLDDRELCDFELALEPDVDDFNTLGVFLNSFKLTLNPTIKFNKQTESQMGMRKCMYICVCVCVWVYVCMCMYVYVYVYVCVLDVYVDLDSLVVETKKQS